MPACWLLPISQVYHLIRPPTSGMLTLMVLLSHKAYPPYIPRFERCLTAEKLLRHGKWRLNDIQPHQQHPRYVVTAFSILHLHSVPSGTISAMTGAS